MKRWVAAPQSNAVTRNGIVGVWLNDNERVEWVYRFTSDGKKIVTGYNILPNLASVIENFVRISDSSTDIP